MSDQNRDVVSATIPLSDPECAVIGVLLMNESKVDAVTSEIAPADFSNNILREIYITIISLRNQNKEIDLITVCDAIKKTCSDIPEVFIFNIASMYAYHSLHLEAYVKIVKENSTLRKLAAAANDMLKQVATPGDKTSIDILRAAEEKISSFSDTDTEKSGPQLLSSIMSDTLQKLDDIYHNKKPIIGLESGYADLDKLTQGFQTADLIIIGGRPSMGKTSLAMNIAEYAAIDKNKTVAIFSLEMSTESILHRMMSSRTRIELAKIKSGKFSVDDWSKIAACASKISDAKIIVDESGGISTTELKARARRIKKEQGGLDLIVIDYLQLLQPPTKKENRDQEVSAISRALKIIAKDLDVPVIALSQLSRNAEQRKLNKITNDKRPIMSDLRDSGAIEQDADMILFVYRDEMINPQSLERGVAELIIAKHRNGPTGSVKLTFLSEITRFENMYQCKPSATNNFTLN